MARRASQNSTAYLVMFAFFWFVFSGLCLYSYFEGSNARKKWNDARKETESAKAKLQQTKEDYAKISALVGYHLPLSQAGILASDPKAIASTLNAICTNKNDLGLDIDYPKIEFSQEQGVDPLAQFGQPEYLRTIPDLQIAWKHCAALINKDGKEGLKPREAKLREELARKYDTHKDETQKTLDKIKEKENEIKEERQKIETAREKYEEDLKNEEKKRNDMQKAKLDAKNRLASLHLKKKVAEYEYKTKLENFDNRIRELKAASTGQTDLTKWIKEKTEEDLQEAPDGQIIYVSENLETASIDLGRNEGILTGLKFQVFRYDKGGKKRIKGEIVVKRVEANMSMAGIMKQTDPLDPVAKGDYIINPVYDKNKVKYFVIAGKLERYSIEQASRLIERIRGKIESEISAKTDFVVLGDGFQSDPVYLRAKERGIAVMMESEFLYYLGE